MRRDIEFDVDGVVLRGWLYVPETGAAPHATVVMAHGFAGLKEMCLDSFAEAFAETGLASLVFDNRNFGASDGQPRQEIDPWQQVGDYRAAITYASRVRTRGYVPWISPTPLLMCVAHEDVLTPSELAIEAYQRAREPKRLVILPGGHFGAYTDSFDISSAAASDWFSQHLLTRAPAPSLSLTPNSTIKN